MVRASEDGDDYALHATAGGCDGDTDVGDMLELFLAELDALECHDEGVFNGDDDLIITSLTATTDASNTAGFCDDSSADTAGVVATDTVVASGAKKPPRKRKRPTGAVNTHYKRQKEELAALRGGVETLKSQLELLRGRQRGQQCLENDRGSRGIVGAGERGDEADKAAKKRAVDDLAKLKARAARELESRQQVTLEYARLRELAEDAREFTRSMESVFAKHAMPSVRFFDAVLYVFFICARAYHPKCVLMV